MIQGVESRESELEKLLVDERKRCNEHKQYYQTLKEEHGKVRDELALIYEQLKEVTVQNEKLKAANDANVHKLESKLKEQQNEINTLLKKLKAYDEKKIQAAVFEEATTHYEQKIKELHTEGDKIREQYNNLHYENAILKCKFESREAEHSRTIERFSLQHQNEIEQLQNKIESLDKEKILPSDTYAVELKSSKREVIQLNSRVKALLTECEELRAQNENLSLQLNSLHRTHSKEISSHLANIRTLESEKMKATMQKEILEKELANSQEYRKVLNNELGASRREILTLKNKLEECEHKCHMTMTNLQIEMEQWKNSKESEHEQFIDEISRLKSELQNLNDGLTKERQAMIVKEQDLQQNLSAARQQIWKLTREMNQEKEKSERKIRDLEAERDDLISQLKQEVASLKQRLNICSTSKLELEKEIVSLREQLEETSKHFGDQTNEINPCQGLNYEREIKELRERIDLLSSGHLQGHREAFVSHAKPSSKSDHEVMQLKLDWEQQKLQFLQRLEELESQLRESRSASVAEKRELEFKVKQYSKQINKLREKLECQKSKNEELEHQKDSLRKNIPPEVHLQVKNQLTELQRRLERYRQLIAIDPNASARSIPTTSFSEKLLADIKNIQYQTLPQQSLIDQASLAPSMKENIEKDLPKKAVRPRRKSLKTREKTQQSKISSPIISSSSDLDLQNL